MKNFLKVSAIVMFSMILAAGAVYAKPLVVGCDTNFMPFEYKEGDKYVGFDIDLWDAIAKDLKLEYKLQPMDFNGLIPALQSGNIDVAIAGMTIKSKREEVVDFAFPYYNAGLYLMVRADEKGITSVDDLADKVVANQTWDNQCRLFKKSKNKRSKAIAEHRRRLHGIKRQRRGCRYIRFTGNPVLYQD